MVAGTVSIRSVVHADRYCSMRKGNMLLRACRTDFAYMFESCAALTALDVSHFVTLAATDMSGMFSGCSGLISLDVSGFNTAQVRNMGSMFYGCSELTFLALGNYDTANVVDMSYMFAGLNSKLQEELKATAETFDTSKANLMGWFD